MKTIWHERRKIYKNTPVVVLGSTGFIGRWMARKLCHAGADVLLPVRDRARAEKLFLQYGISGTLFELDHHDNDAVRAFYRKVRPAVTFNLVGYGIDRSEQDEKLAYLTNAELIKTLCSAIQEVRHKDWPGLDIVNAGTAMEYGRAAGDLAETSNPQPTTLYGKSKLAGTQVLTQCCTAYQLKGLTARLFSVYGPGESPQRLLPTLIAASQTDNPIPLTSGGHNRDFLYVEDAAESLFRLALSVARPGEVVNSATGVLKTVKDFVETSSRACGIEDKRLRFGTLPTRPEEMHHGPVTNARLKVLTGWLPTTTIAAGVRRTLLHRPLL